MVEGWCIDETLKETDLQDMQKVLQDEQAKLEAKLKKLTPIQPKEREAEACKTHVSAVETRETLGAEHLESARVESPKRRRVDPANNTRPEVDVSTPTDQSSLSDGKKESGSPERKRKRVSWRDESDVEMPLEEVKNLTQSSTTSDRPEPLPEKANKKKSLIYEGAFDSDSSDDLFAILTPSKVKTYERKPNTSVKGMKFFKSRGVSKK